MMIMKHIYGDGKSGEEIDDEILFLPSPGLQDGCSHRQRHQTSRPVEDDDYDDDHDNDRDADHILLL